MFITAIRRSAERVGPHWASISPPLESLSALFTKEPAVCLHMCKRERQKESDCHLCCKWTSEHPLIVKCPCLLLLPGSRSQQGFLCSKCCLLSLLCLCLYPYTVAVSLTDRASWDSKRKTRKEREGDTVLESKGCKERVERWMGLK